MNIVWTVHNLRPQDSTHPRLERAWLRIFANNVSATICLSRSGEQALRKALPSTCGTPTYVIPHGHYRDWYSDTIAPVEAKLKLDIEPDRNVALFLGLIRPYKNVPRLIGCFTECSTRNWTLIVAGNPESKAIRDEIRYVVGCSRQIRLELGFVENDMLQTYFRAADLFVAPYSDVLNSGSAILSLSFDCPVLVPNMGAMADLQEIVGRDWVMTYDGELDASTVGLALKWAGDRRMGRAPLDGLDWSRIADLTVRALRETAHG